MRCRTCPAGRQLPASLGPGSELFSSPPARLNEAASLKLCFKWKKKQSPVEFMRLLEGHDSWLGVCGTFVFLLDSFEATFTLNCNTPEDLFGM